MSIKGNPKLCPQKSFDVDTQTSDVEDNVSEGKEVSGDSSESYIVDSSEYYTGEKEEDDDPFFTCFGEIGDKAFHNMMSINDLTYSTLFCDKVFDSDLWYSHASLESCNVMGEYARHGKKTLEISIQSAREKGISYYFESSSDEKDELYTSGSKYSNTGHFRHFAFDTNSVTDYIHCMDGFESELEEFYEDCDSDSDYFSADESLEEFQDASCQSFPNGSQGVVGSEKSTLSDCVIRGSGERRSSFGEEIDALYMCSNDSSCVNNLTSNRSSLADQGELDEVKSLPIPTIQTSVLMNTTEGSRLSKFKLVDELYNDSILSNSDEVNSHNNIWSILTDRLMYSRQDDKLVKNEAKLLYENNELKLQNAQKKYFDAYNSNKPLDKSGNQSKEKEMLPKHQNDKFNAANSNRPSVNVSSTSLIDKQHLEHLVKEEYVEDRYKNVQVELSAKFNPNQHICASYLWTEEESEDKTKPVIADTYDENYNKMWFKEGRFPINIHGESLGYLLNGIGIKIKVNTHRFRILKANIE